MDAVTQALIILYFSISTWLASGWAIDRIENLALFWFVAILALGAQGFALVLLCSLL
jgi:hypothetical protein